MSVSFQTSETRKNLMRAFAGESQARNRHTFAAECAHKQKQHAIEAVFRFTADQEKAHAKIFYDHLKQLSGETIAIDGSYPVDVYEDLQELLRAAAHNEFEEHDDVYPAFQKTAAEEGFPTVAASFHAIAEVEKTHGSRFSHLADLLAQGKLYLSDAEERWVCLNCGYIHEGTEVPPKCPVCHEEQGYFISLSFAPYQM